MGASLSGGDPVDPLAAPTVVRKKLLVDVLEIVEASAYWTSEAWKSKW